MRSCDFKVQRVHECRVMRACIRETECDGRGGTSKVTSPCPMDQKPAFRLYTLGSFGLGQAVIGAGSVWKLLGLSSNTGRRNRKLGKRKGTRPIVDRVPECCQDFRWSRLSLCHHQMPHGTHRAPHLSDVQKAKTPPASAALAAVEPTAEGAREACHPLRQVACVALMDRRLGRPKTCSPSIAPSSVAKIGQDCGDLAIILREVQRIMRRSTVFSGLIGPLPSLIRSFCTARWPHSCHCRSAVTVVRHISAGQPHRRLAWL